MNQYAPYFYKFYFVNFCVIFSGLHLNSFIKYHMPDEFHKDETCKSHITLVKLSNFILLYHLRNFPVLSQRCNISLPFVVLKIILCVTTAIQEMMKIGFASSQNQEPAPKSHL